MAAIIEKKHQQKLAEELARKTHFSKFEIECLQKKFRQLTKDKLEKTKFRDILHNSFAMTDDMIMDRIFRGFDKDNDSYISMEEWIRGLSIFLRGSLDEQMQFCFDVYDLNGDGMISREEMFNLLKNSMVKQASDEDPDEGIRELVELIIKKLDLDGDHRISYPDYKESTKSDDLLLQCLGQCLPDDKVVMCVEQDTFTPQESILLTAES